VNEPKRGRRPRPADSRKAGRQVAQASWPTTRNLLPCRPLAFIPSRRGKAASSTLARSEAGRACAAPRF